MEMGLKETGEAYKFRVSDTNYFASLPEECIFLILSKTSPRDLCRLSVVSLAFRSASESDVVWENFLPLDLPETTVSISSLFASKKDLFFCLCRHHYPALVDYGSKFVELDKSSGKIKCMLGSTTLFIECYKKHPGFDDGLILSKIPKSRGIYMIRWSSTIDVKSQGSALHIQCKIDTRILSPNTYYAVYFLYTGVSVCTRAGNLTSFCLLTEISIRTSSSTSREVVISSETKVHHNIINIPRGNDGWIELKIGEFFTGKHDKGIVEMSLKELKERCVYKRICFVLGGIEIRPIEKVYNS